MAERLAADGNDVDVITTFPHYPEWSFVEGAPPRTKVDMQDGVRVTRVRHRLPARGSSISRVLSELSFGARALLRRWQRPEAVVLVSPALFASAVVVPRLLLTRTPFVIWVQDLYGLGIKETSGAERLGVFARMVGRLEGWMLRRADSVVVIHEGMAAAVAKLAVDPDRLTIQRNWTHIETAAEIDRDRVRSQHGWSQDEIVVLHTGNMGLKQDLANVVEAGRLADSRSADVRFVLMGDGTERPALEEAAAGVQRVQLLPPQPAEEYQQMLQAADVLLVNEHPGVRGMALPSKLTSYFASGRPVLAATSEDSATASELRRASTGVRVDAGHPADLLEAVGALTDDPALMRALVRSANRYRKAELSVDGAAQRFDGVLRRTADRSSLRAPQTTRSFGHPAERDLVLAEPAGHELRTARLAYRAAEETSTGPISVRAR
jgi:colanic acid biosynthesis glycosyl transferase WcaI